MNSQNNMSQNNMSNTCTFIITRGISQGCLCGIKTSNGANYCSRHNPDNMLKKREQENLKREALRKEKQLLKEKEMKEQSRPRCDYVFPRGINQRTFCDVHPRDKSHRCSRHNPDNMLKKREQENLKREALRKEKQLLKEKEMKEQSRPRCDYVFPRGINQGEFCGVYPQDKSHRCSYHKPENMLKKQEQYKLEKQKLRSQALSKQIDDIINEYKNEQDFEAKYSNETTKVVEAKKKEEKIQESVRKTQRPEKCLKKRKMAVDIITLMKKDSTFFKSVSNIFNKYTAFTRFIWKPKPITFN